MPRLRFRTFAKGLWLMGARDQVPAGALRRAQGLTAVKDGPMRSRWGLTRLFSLAAHSLFRFENARYAGVGGGFYRDGVLINTQLTGAHLAFVTQPPQFDKPDYLFVAGGGGGIAPGFSVPFSQLFKVASDGTTSLWGIYAPSDGFTAQTLPANSNVLDTLDNTNVWSPANCTIFYEPTILQDGTASMKQFVLPSVIGTATRALAADLTVYPDTTPSSGQDTIQLWVRVDNPSNLTQLQLQFDVGLGDFSSDYYTRTITVEDIPPSTQLSEQTVGVGSPGVLPPGFVFGPDGQPGIWITSNSGEGENTVFTPLDISNIPGINTGQTTVTTALGAWVLLRIPKDAFQRSGTSAATWANVAAVRFSAQTNANGPIIVYWDRLSLVGATGMLGPYRYRVTFRNTTTGSRSNPNPTDVTVGNVQRQPVLLQNLPVSTDPQVDVKEIWRTVGGGAVMFKAAEIANSSVTFTDTVSDFLGFNGPLDSSTLLSEQLQFDNARPSDTFDDAFGPIGGQMLWTRDATPGQRGRMFFSPVGRPESLLGFVDVTRDGDTTQKGVVWNGIAYVFTTGGIFRVTGGGSTFLPQQITGAPGTIAPFSVTPTPYGIMYLANDGVRSFDGVYSRLLAFEPIGNVFRGEALENVPPIQNNILVRGAFQNDEYVVSDTSTTMAVNLRDLTWREIGVGIRALYAEKETGLLLGTWTAQSKVVIVEAEGVTADDTDPIFVQFQTPHALVDVANVGVVQRLYLDLDTDGQPVSPVIIYDDDTEEALPSCQTTARETVEYAINRSARMVGVRLQAFLAARITVYGVEVDVYVPGVDSQKLGVS